MIWFTLHMVWFGKVWSSIVCRGIVWYGLVKYSMGKVNMSGAGVWYVLERQDIPDPIVIVGATRGRHNGLVSCITHPSFLSHTK